MQLDAIRGIAALVVVFHHYIQIFPEQIRQLASYPQGLLAPAAWLTPWPWFRITPLRLLVDGHAAVLLFFLLSGFVLTLPLTAREQPLFAPFVVKRICRVYVPFAVTVLVIAACHYFLPMPRNPSASHWFNDLIPSIGNVSLADHLLMTGRDISLNPVMWTLIHELRISFLLPLIFLAIRRYGAVRTALGAVMFSALCTSGIVDSVSASWRATGHFLWMFCAGAALSFEREAVRRFVASLSPVQAAFGWGCALVLLVAPFDRTWTDYLVGAGAALLIAMSLRESMVVAALSTRFPRWLGRISYSLYLIHWPILFFAVSNDAMPWWAALMLTLALAEFTFRTIEYPSHRLGIFLESRLRGSR